MWWWMAAACWHDTLWAPPPGATSPPAWYELALDDAVIGAEAWWRLGDRTVRRRVTQWSVDGVVQQDVTEVAVRVHGDGWQRDLGDGWEAVGLAPEMFRADPGPQPVADVFGEHWVDAEVEVDGATVTTTGPFGPVRVSFDAMGPVRASFGRLSLQRVASQPQWHPPELTELLSIEVEPFGTVDPRRARVAHWGVDGEAVVVIAPLRAELPRRPVGARKPPSGPVGAWAVEATRGSPDRWAQVERLAAAVPATLDHRPRRGEVAAEALLETPHGDCTEHVTLFVAAVEGLGGRARAVSGLLLERSELGGRLVPHAWAEVDVEGRWVAVDPTFGMAPSDAGRLPLGGIDEVSMRSMARRPVVTLETLR